MNIVDISQHIGECLTALTEASYPHMKAVILIHGGEDDISMITNFSEQPRVFEVLTRSMVSCFGPHPSGGFKAACLKFKDTIQPAIDSFTGADSIVCCFWDDKIKEAAMLSSINNRSVAFAIICEHMVRVISGVDCYYDADSASRTLH